MRGLTDGGLIDFGRSLAATGEGKHRLPSGDGLGGEPSALLDGSVSARLDELLRSKGFERWRSDGEDDGPDRPVLEDSARYGLPGEILRAIEPTSEADPAGLLLVALALFGWAAGAGPHARADGANHPGRLNVALVGATSRARKSSALRNVERVFEAAEPELMRTRRVSGLGSGEVLVDAVSDAQDGEGRVPDRRLLVVEDELASILQVVRREGSRLSAVVRDAWDGRPLAARSRAAGQVTATGAHVAIVAAITAEELGRQLTSTEQANGFGNRFLWVHVGRSKLLPHGQGLDEAEVAPLAEKVRRRLGEARKLGRLSFDEAAREMWESIYAKFAEDAPGGVVGALTARAEAQALRLAVAYAASDGSRLIQAPHLEAAVAVWAYSRRSVEVIFGEGLDGSDEGRLLRAIREAGAEGLSTTQQHSVFGGHRSARDRAAMRAVLERRRAIVTVEEPTEGRTRTVSYAVRKSARSAISLGKGQPGGLSAHVELLAQSREPSEGAWWDALEAVAEAGGLDEEAG